MIIGNGIDIVEIGRIQRAIQRWGKEFSTRVFTTEEITYSQAKKFSSQHLAVRFAAKEATIKAFSSAGVRFVRWKDIEILNDNSGKPQVKLHGYYKRLQRERRINDVLLSMSHAKDYALASVILVGDRDEQKR